MNQVSWRKDAFFVFVLAVLFSIVTIESQILFDLKKKKITKVTATFTKRDVLWQDIYSRVAELCSRLSSTCKNNKAPGPTLHLCSWFFIPDPSGAARLSKKLSLTLRLQKHSITGSYWNWCVVGSSTCLKGDETRSLWHHKGLLSMTEWLSKHFLKHGASKGWSSVTG